MRLIAPAASFGDRGHRAADLDRVLSASGALDLMRPFDLWRPSTLRQTDRRCYLRSLRVATPVAIVEDRNFSVRVRSKVLEHLTSTEVSHGRTEREHRACVCDQS